MGLASKRDKTPNEEYLVDTLNELRQSFFDWAARHAPDKVTDFQKANAAWANLIRLNRAAARAKADSVPTPSQYLDAISNQATKAQMATGRVNPTDPMSAELPLWQLARDAQELLPSRLNESGTVPRGLATAGLGLTTAGPAAITSLLSPAMALPAAKAAIHMPGIDRMLQALALQRRASAVRAGRAIRNRQGLGSVLTVPLAVEHTAVNQ
jgi:hypothetical protein